VSYSTTYQHLLELTAKPRDKRGKKIYGAYWAKRDPVTPGRVLVGQYYRPSVNDKPRWERVKPKHGVFVPHLQLDQTSFTIDYPHHYRKVEIKLDPEHAKEYPAGVKPLVYGTYKSVDCSLNNLLYNLRLEIQHAGNRDPKKPGFIWSYRNATQNIFGPVHVDTIAGTMHPVISQPEKLVDTELRTRAAKLLRKTYLRMRMLERMEISFTTKDLTDLAGPDTKIKYSDSAAVAKFRDGLYANWADPYKLLDKMEHFDARSREETAELILRMHAVVHKANSWFYVNHSIHNFIERNFPPILLHTPQQVERTRRALYKTLDVVRYEVA